MARRKIKRLMVFLPPGHAKSEFASRFLPAYAFGRNPDLRIIACSHTDEFAGTINRDVQRIMCEEGYVELFPGTRLNDRAVRTSAFGQYRRTTDYFEIVGRSGYYKSAGVGGNVTGRRFDLGIIDDPIKSREQADSPTSRRNLWDWYANDFYTRQWTDASIVLMHTRWNRDDLAGQLLRKMADRSGDQWEILSLPSIAGESKTHADDPRAPGEPLWPAFKSREALEVIRHQDARAFAALYQQDPAEAGNAEWPPELFGEWIWCPVEKWPSEFDLRVVCVDPSKGRQDKPGDYCAIVFLGVHNGLCYVDAELERIPLDRIAYRVLRFCDRYRPHFVGCEADQFQELLIHELRRQASDFAQRWPFFKVNTGGVSKVARIRRITQYVVNRELRLKSDSPGCRLLADQMMDFPLAEHDDGPDALEMCTRLPQEVSGV